MLASECLREQDPELEAARTIFAVWLDVFGDQSKTAAEVTAAADSAPALADALQLICSRDKPSARIVRMATPKLRRSYGTA